MDDQQRGEQWLTVGDALPTVRLSRSKFYTFLGTEIPVVKIGRAVRIRKSDLDSWMARQAAATKQARGAE